MKIIKSVVITFFIVKFHFSSAFHITKLIMKNIMLFFISSLNTKHQVLHYKTTFSAKLTYHP